MLYIINLYSQDTIDFFSTESAKKIVEKYQFLVTNEYFIDKAVKLYESKDMEKFYQEYIGIKDIIPSFLSSIDDIEKEIQTILSSNLKMDEKVLNFFSDYVKELKKNKLKVIQDMEKSGEKLNRDNEKKAQEIKKYLDKLETLTDEKPRKYDPKPEKEETNQQRNESTSKINDHNRKVKGVGYGRDNYYSYNNSWDVNKYLDKKQPNSQEIINILKSIIEFINNQSM